MFTRELIAFARRHNETKALLEVFRLTVAALVSKRCDRRGSTRDMKRMAEAIQAYTHIEPLAKHVLRIEFPEFYYRLH